MATAPGQLAGKLAFVRGGEVWLARLDGQEAKPFTATNAKVNSFLFSPDLRYLAYTRITGYGFEEGDDDEQAQREAIAHPTRPLCSLVVQDLASGRVVLEIPHGEDESLSLLKWIPKDRILFYEADGMAAGSPQLADVESGMEIPLDPPISELLDSAHFTPGGERMVFSYFSNFEGVEERQFEVADLKSGSRWKLLDRDVLSPALSPDGRTVAYLEVVPQRGGPSSQYKDQVWLIGAQGGAARKLFEGPAVPKSGREPFLLWSPDGRRLAVGYQDPRLFKLDDPGAPQEVKGRGPIWVGPQTLLISQWEEGRWERTNVLVRVDFAKGKETLLVRHAASPQYLVNKAYRYDLSLDRIRHAAPPVAPEPTKKKRQCQLTRRGGPVHGLSDT